MATLQAEDIVDLVTMTQNDLGEMKMTDLSYDLQKYIAMSKIMAEKKVSFSAGTELQWNVLVNDGDNARNVGEFAKDQPNQKDGMQTAKVPWKHSDTHYLISRHQIAMNRSPRKILDIVKEKRHMSMVSYAKLFETNFWSKPSDSDDSLKPFGVPYWIVKSATTPAGGLTGTNPSGFTSGCGGLSSTTYPQWANWSATYTAITKENLFRRLRKACEFTNFTAPIPHENYSRGDERSLCTTYDVLQEAEEIAEQQNDNLGNDIASKDGKTVFRGIKLEWVPYLQENDSQGPIYGINWADFRPVFLEGEFMREDKIEKWPGSHNLMAAYTDCTYNFRCENRRTQFVVYNAS